MSRLGSGRLRPSRLWFGKGFDDPFGNMNINIDVPQDVYEQARQIAEAEHVPLGEVFASAFAEHAANF